MWTRSLKSSRQNNRAWILPPNRGCNCESLIDESRRRKGDQRNSDLYRAAFFPARPCRSDENEFPSSDGNLDRRIRSGRRPGRARDRAVPLFFAETSRLSDETVAAGVSPANLESYSRGQCQSGSDPPPQKSKAKAATIAGRRRLLPLMALSYSFIALCISCIALRMSCRAFCRASNFFC